MAQFEGELFYEPDDIPDDIDAATADSLRNDHAVSQQCHLLQLLQQVTMPQQLLYWTFEVLQLGTCANDVWAIHKPQHQEVLML